jgi:hypothetical protein
MAALAAEPAPLDAASLAGRFRQVRRATAKIGSVLGALQRMGFVTTADAGHSVSLGRAALRPQSGHDAKAKKGFETADEGKHSAPYLSICALLRSSAFICGSIFLVAPRTGLSGTMPRGRDVQPVRIVNPFRQAQTQGGSW